MIAGSVSIQRLRAPAGFDPIADLSGDAGLSVSATGDLTLDSGGSVVREVMGPTTYVNLDEREAALPNFYVNR